MPRRRSFGFRVGEFSRTTTPGSVNPQISETGKACTIITAKAKTEGDSLVAEDQDETLEGFGERRQFDRSRLVVDAFFDGQDATGVASTTDISVGGFYLKTQTELPIGSKLLVRIPLREGHQIVAHAVVVYVSPGRGMGLSFQSLSDENRALIESELGSD
jgi:PilZ domain